MTFEAKFELTIIWIVHHRESELISNGPKSLLQLPLLKEEIKSCEEMKLICIKNHHITLLQLLLPERIVN